MIREQTFQQRTRRMMGSHVYQYVTPDDRVEFVKDQLESLVFLYKGTHPKYMWSGKSAYEIEGLALDWAESLQTKVS